MCDTRIADLHCIYINRTSYYLVRVSTLHISIISTNTNITGPVSSIVSQIKDKTNCYCSFKLSFFVENGRTIQSKASNKYSLNIIDYVTGEYNV